MYRFPSVEFNMELTSNFVLVLIILAALVVDNNAVSVLHQEYKIEAFQKDGDSEVLVLEIQPSRKSAGAHRQGRQGENEDENEGERERPHIIPAITTPLFIPAVIPALTKILNGIITGNLNDIFHGSTSFAPQNISYAIDTVYNSVVGIGAPISTPPTTHRSFVQATEEPARPTAPPTSAPAVQATEKPSTSSSEVVVQSLYPAPSVLSESQPLQGNSLIISTSTTKKPISNEEDEDEFESEGFGFRKLRRKERV